MNIFPTQEDSTRKFSLWCNEKLYEYPADTFTRVSKKCAALVKANDYQGTITHPVSEETFEAFSAACKLEPFKVTLNNAFELLELAQEWGIPSLETFVTNYIVAKGIKRRDMGDPLGDLLIHIEEEQEDPRLIHDAKHIAQKRLDIEGVAHMFNQYLTDERLAQVLPEILFKIMMQAEQFQINQQLLIDFVMKLLESEPEKAIPLCLRIDFDLLTDAQIEMIFQAREIHEESLGYFIADSISALRNKQQNLLSENEQRYLKEMQDIREYIIKERTGVLAKIQEEYDKKYEGLTKTSEDQENQINELKKLRDELQQMMDDEDANFNHQVHRFEKEMAKQQKLLDQRQAVLDSRHELIDNGVNTKAPPIVDDALARIKEIMEEDEKRRQQLKQNIEQLLVRLRKHQELEKNRLDEVNRAIDAIHDRITVSLASVAAKIVNDQFNYNFFLRDISNKLDLFNTDPKIWDLTPEIVEENLKIVVEIEESLKKTCPMNVNHQIRASMEVFTKFANTLTGGKFA